MIADIQLRDLDGIELTQLIRQETEPEFVPFVFFPIDIPLEEPAEVPSFRASQLQHFDVARMRAGMSEPRVRTAEARPQ